MSKLDAKPQWGGNNYPVWRWERPKSEVELGNLLEDFFHMGEMLGSDNVVVNLPSGSNK